MLTDAGSQVDLATAALSPRPPGPLLFARYAIAPNRLGLCGPNDSAALQQSAGAGALGELRHLAEGFEGAYPYLQLIASANGIADPLDRSVVEAYWIGNELTPSVTTRALHRSMTERFRARVSRREWRWLEMAIAAGSLPLHAFHVLEVFPRAGLLRGGDPEVLPTMDACRIRWGRLLAVEGERLIVSAPRLEAREGVLRIGAPQIETVLNPWATDDVPPDLAAGDVLSLHWGWACDRLSPDQARRLAAWTVRALDIANHAQTA